MSSRALRDQLVKKLAAIEAEQRALDEARENLHKGAAEHADRSHMAAERLRTRLGPEDFDTDEAKEYDGHVRDRHTAGLMHGYLARQGMRKKKGA